MRVVWLLVIASTACIASAVPLSESHGRQYSRFIKFPDGEGNYHQVDLEAEPDTELLTEIARNPANNLYLLYTRANPTTSQMLVMNNVESIESSNFNPNVPTVVISHGWLSSQDTNINPIIRDAYLGKGDVNVIVLDWWRLALADYATAVRGVPDIGRGLGLFIDFLCRTSGASLSDFHIVGHSLGAHVVGNAGKALQGRVARVTGLDPAGPMWYYNTDRLSANDGVYVEAIHTDGGVDGLGIGIAIAHADFFPNGGMSQPGCLTGKCDHDRAFEFFASTITYNHLIGTQCSTVTQVTMNTCRGSKLPMGNDDLRKFGLGLYRVDTGWRYPY